MKTYTLIGGVNGVGKSSLTGVLVHTDGGLGKLVRTSGEAERCIAEGLSFAQETTLSGDETLQTVKRAVGSDYIFKLIYVGVGSCEECLQRVLSRVKKGGHSIPPEDVKRRYDKRFSDLAAVLPYCSEAEFWDNENGFVLSGEYRNGTLTLYEGCSPQWLRDFTQYFIHERK